MTVVQGGFGELVKSPLGIVAAALGGYWLWSRYKKRRR